MAPSGGNNQTTRFMVITNKKRIDELSAVANDAFAAMELTPDTYPSLALAIRLSKKGTYRFHYGAPVLVLAANKKDYGNNMADSAIAIENMMIMANALDLGSCYINQIHWLTENSAMRQLLYDMGMKEDENVYASAVLGHPNTKDNLPIRTPLPRKGNPVEWIR